MSLVVADIEGLTLQPCDLKLLDEPALAAIILFARNYSNPEQLDALVGALRERRQDLLIAVDQEGGRVQRFREGFTVLPAMQELVNLGERAHKGASDIAWLMASELIVHGVDFSFAPVVDLDRDKSQVIGDRAFSDEPELCTSLAEAFIEGMADAGMAATLKHFPGHGSVVADSHVALPLDERAYEQIESHDLRPFAALSQKAKAVMTAHILFPNVDDNIASYSKFWLQSILRNNLGFEGCIFSDDLKMLGADASLDIVERGKLALAAGCDALIVCNDHIEAMRLLKSLRHEKGSGRIDSMRAKPLVDLKIQESPRYQSAQDAIETLKRLKNENK